MELTRNLTDSASVAATATASTAQNTGSATATDITATDSATGSATGSVTSKASASGSSKASASGSKSGSGSSSAKHSTSYDARLPAGGISMMTPAATETSYYKIGEYITFGWNYTSLSATPTAINIMATCTENSQLYTISMNQTVSGTGSVVWDTGKYQSTAVQNPLLTETYTLIIYDAGSSISATAQAGYLSVFDSYTFGMYTPQPYVPLDQFVCATCSGALSSMERAALKMVLGMGLLTVLSFTWFVSGTGIIW
ncbi:hypothetical protein BP6252_01665 [Coleophoma cylindrospora]|uniref:DUF7137 domain-containing protein n=1 Tax=Coleophoma cylindrospora TaxID=1849047 RepID=A0A3D8STJ2_9HELO|nr:hypothetical protein BP6252_01665 [Coleophoma cylindrospora]